jgi:prepilin peptidase CpaA
MSSVAAPVAVCIFTYGMAQAFVGDLTTMTIRNSLVLFLIGAYIFLAPCAGMPSQAILHSALAAILVLIVGFVLFLRGGIGAGDVKFAAAATLWLGADQALAFLVHTALFGGVLTILLLTARRLNLPSAFKGVAWIRRLHDRQTGVPYGIALALAGLAVLPTTQWLKFM